MKLDKRLVLLLLVVFIPIVSAIPWSPQGNVDLKLRYNLTNLSFIETFTLNGVMYGGSINTSSVTVAGGNSANWNSVFTAYSANFTYIYDYVLDNDDNWNATYISWAANHSTWDSLAVAAEANWSVAYTSWATNHSNWDDAAANLNAHDDIWNQTSANLNTYAPVWNQSTANLNAHADNWNLSYNWTSTRQDEWENAYGIVNANHANWNATYLSWNANHSNWDSVYNGWVNNFTTLFTGATGWLNNATAVMAGAFGWTGNATATIAAVASVESNSPEYFNYTTLEQVEINITGNWTDQHNYPSGCASGTFVTINADANTCTAPTAADVDPGTFPGGVYKFTDNLNMTNGNITDIQCFHFTHGAVWCGAP